MWLNLYPSDFYASCSLLSIIPLLLQPPDSDQYHSQHVINMVMSLPIRKGPGVRMNVSVREHRALINHMFDVAKFTILTPLSLLSKYRFSFPIVSLKIFCLPTFELKSPNRLFV